MGKIDTTAIEGYADMTPEQKLAALENLELADPDYSGYVAKSVFDKTASDLAKLKKDNEALKKENMAKLSEDERAKQERDEELQKLRERNAELERNVAISVYKAKYLALGYNEALATETAQAWADGDHDKVIANTAAFLTAHDKQVKAGMLGEMPTPPAGSGTKTITAEEIMQIKDDVKRQQMIADHLDLFQ